ncbi:MAG: YggL family protein [Tannerella sp.]|jgi:hypothetical protein|nr:YggL family protein [Tannerella sp.]
MKKRIRNKLHKGEFRQHGISIMVPVDMDNVESRLDAILDVADNNHILFIGGGLGHFVLPSEEYGNMDIPKKIESLVKHLALSNGSQPDCIIGYFCHPTEKEINVNVADKIKAELESTLKTEFKINCRIDLWN